MTAENLTFLDIVTDVAADYGRTVTEGEALLILWEHTGYPSFWPTGRPVDDCVNQLDEFFRVREYGWVPCRRCGRPAPEEVSICEPCDREIVMAR